MKSKKYLKKSVEELTDEENEEELYDPEPTFAFQAYVEFMTKQIEIAEAKGESFDYLSRPTEPITFPKGLLDL